MRWAILLRRALIRRRLFRVLYALLGVWTLWPIASALLANGLGHALHCKLSEGAAAPCILFGVDITHRLYIGALAHWYALVTLPSGVLLLGLVAAIHLVVCWFRKAPTN